MARREALRRFLTLHWPVYLLIWLTALATQLPVLADYTRLVPTLPDGTVHPDTLNYLYAQHRFAIQLVDGENPLRDPTQNAPEGLDLIYLDLPWLMFGLLAPVSAYLRPEAAANLLVLAAHGLSGMLAYHWVRLRGTPGRAAPLFAGLAVVLLPWRLAHALNHPNLVSTQFVLGWLLVLELWLQRRVRGGWLSLLVGGAAFLVTAGSFQLALMTVLVTPLLLLPALLAAWRSRRLSLAPDDTAALTAGLCGGLIGALPLLTAQPVQLAQFSAEATAKFSADWLSWWRPPGVTLAGGLLPAPLPASEEQILTVGLIIAAVACYGVLRGGRQAAAALLLVAVSVLLSFGPQLTLAGGVAVPMPAALAEWVGVTAFRAWARFGLFAGLGLIALAASGVAQLLARRPAGAPRRILAGVLLTLLLVELLPLRQRAAPVAQEPLSAMIAGLPADAVTMMVPNVASDSFAETLYALRFGLVREYRNNHLVSYAHSAHRPLQYAAFEREMRRLDEPTTPLVLCRMGVTHLLISERYWQRTPQLAAAGLQTLDTSQADWRLTALPTCPPPDGAQP